MHFIIKSIAVGFCSGVVSSILWAATRDLRVFGLFQTIVLGMPGIVFGLFVGAFFYTQQNHVISFIKWFGFSFAAYYIAFRTTIFIAVFIATEHFFTDAYSSLVIPSSTMLGGLLGGILTLIGFRLYINKLSRMEVILLSILSAMIGLMWGFLPVVDVANSSDFLLNKVYMSVLLISWQTIMSGLLGVIVSKHRSVNAGQASPISTIG